MKPPLSSARMATAKLYETTHSKLHFGPEVTKASIRQAVWDYLESNDLVNFPRPVHHRIPNFKGAAAAGEKLSKAEEFQQAQTIKVDPDKPQESVRFLTLQANKTLLVPTPRLRHGLFNRIMPPKGGGKDILRKCATSQGVRDFSVPVGLDSKMKIHLVVVGAVAVSEKGYRLGKGEGYADLEHAMMISMGAITMDTVVMTTVHDCQVVDIPDHLIGEHDVCVDYIFTPTRVIKCNIERHETNGIIWAKLDEEQLAKIPVLRQLREMDRKAGKDVRTKADIEYSTSK